MVENGLTGNRTVDIKLFADVIHMLGRHFYKNTSITLQEDYKKRKDWYHCYLLSVHYVTFVRIFTP